MAKTKAAKKEKPAMEEKQIAVKEAAALPAEVGDVNAWGNGGLSASDIVIPRILLMQGMSQKVLDGEAAFGEFRESLNNELLGKFDKGFEVIPFAMRKVFIEYDASDEKKKRFLRVVPITPKNEDLPYEDEEKNLEGKLIPVSRDRVMEFYVLRPEEIDMGGAMPYILSFRRTGLKNGKKLATQMYVKNTSAGKTPASVIVTVLATKESNNEGTWAVTDVALSRPTPDKYIAEAFKWLQLINQGRAKVDESAYAEESGAVAVDAEVDLDNGPAKF
jgi:hypothetical protein